MASLNVDQEIARVQGIYRQITGNDPHRPDGTMAPIPPEANAEQFVRENLARLQSALAGQRLDQRPAAPTIVPRINVLENESQWACEVEMPGVERNDLQVQVQLNRLHIAGTRRDGRETTGELRPVHVETTGGRFDRVLPLPQTVDTETASAKLDRGMLQVTFQKNVRAAAQRDIRVEIA